MAVRMLNVVGCLMWSCGWCGAHAHMAVRMPNVGFARTCRVPSVVTAHAPGSSARAHSCTYGLLASSSAAFALAPRAIRASVTCALRELRPSTTNSQRTRACARTCSCARLWPWPRLHLSRAHWPVKSRALATSARACRSRATRGYGHGLRAGLRARVVHGHGLPHGRRRVRGAHGVKGGPSAPRPHTERAWPATLPRSPPQLAATAPVVHRHMTVRGVMYGSAAAPYANATYSHRCEHSRLD